VNIISDLNSLIAVATFTKQLYTAFVLLIVLMISS